MIEPRIFRGTRDFLPEEMIHREEILKAMRLVFQKYGFEPIETPAIEYLNVLSGKYGEEADRLIYRLNYKVGSKDEAALHYDLTVPFSRLIAMNKNNLIFPFKRYQIQPVWRADNPQPRQGRFREFYQCDIDVVGSNSMLADAEIITVVNEIITKLGFKNILIKINNRKILNGIVEYIGLDSSLTGLVCRTIDKLDKISIAEALNELKLKNISGSALKKLESLFRDRISFENNLEEIGKILSKSSIGKSGVAETLKLFDYLKSMGSTSNFKFDFTLARGLDYYTGPIFETTLPEHPHIGSLSGGGRYDELIGVFSGVNVPATGTSLGLDRILSAMKQLNMLSRAPTRTKILVTTFSENAILKSLEIVTLLRLHNINSEIYHEPIKLKNQFSYADKKGIPLVIIMGEDEIKNENLTIKIMSTGEQKSMKKDEFLKWLLEVFLKQ